MIINNKITLIFSLVLLFGAISSKAQALEARQTNNQPLSCELSLLYQNLVLQKAIETLDHGGVLIVIIRPGDLEKSRKLIARRLYNLRTFFDERSSRLSAEKVLIAEGESMKGYGALEYYLNGKLYERLLYPTNGYICHSCCGPDTNYYPDKKSSK